MDTEKPETTILWNSLFHTYARKEEIINQFNAGDIGSGYHHPQYPKHAIMAFWQANKMLGLVALQQNIGIDMQYESGMYFGRFSKKMSLTTTSARHYINKKTRLLVQ